MDEWDFLTLEEAGIELLDCVHKTPSAQPTGLPYVAIPQLQNGEIDLSDARRISASDFEEWTKKADPQPYDMVLSRRCNPGETAFVRPGLRFALGQNLVLLRADGKRVRPPFLRWMVRSPYWWSEINKFLNVGAVFDSLRCSDVPKFSLPVPPLKEQDAIAALLGALDDKVALNRRMNSTLEAIARAIFHDWFVDFGPTRAKVEGREPYVTSDLWALFPDVFDEQGKPLGWGDATLADIAELNPESWSRANYPDHVHYVDLSNTKWGVVEAVTEFSRDSAPSRAQRILRSGDTIVGTVRPGNGSYAFIGEDGLTGSTGFAVLRPRERAYREFTYLAATSFANIQRLAHVADGGAYPAVRPDAVIRTPVIGFHKETIKRFSELVGPLIDKIEANKREAKSLATARDLLLPKLMSGEVRLKAAAAQVEEAL